MITNDQALQWQADAEESLGDALNGYLLEAKPVAMGLSVVITDLDSDKSVKRTLTKDQVDQHRLNVIETAAKVSIAELKDGMGI